MSKDVNKRGDQRRKDDCEGQGYFDLINGQVKIVFKQQKYPYTEALVYEYYDSLLTVLKMTGEVKKLMGFSTKIGNITNLVHEKCGGYPTTVITDLPESLINAESRGAINNLLGRYINAYLYGDFKPEEVEQMLTEVSNAYQMREENYRLGDLLSNVKNTMCGRYGAKIIELNSLRHKTSISPQIGRVTLNQLLNRVYGGMTIFSLNKQNTVRDFQLQSHNFNFSGYRRYWHTLEGIERAHTILNDRINEHKEKTIESFSKVVNLVKQLELDTSGRSPEEIVDSLIKETVRRDFWRKKIKEEKKNFSSYSHEQATHAALTITELDNQFKNRKSRRRSSTGGNSP